MLLFTTFVNILPKLRYFEGRDYIQIGCQSCSVLLFSDRSMKGGTSWISRDGGISEREEVDLETGGGGEYDPPPPPLSIMF